MITRQDDEETPLLQRPEQPIARTPLPCNQFWIILFLQLSDPFSSQTLAPFTPQLIRDIGVTHGDESQVGHYVAILQSSYYAAHALTIFYWSQLSDHVGRKPVLLTSLLATSVSMFLFGLSKNFLGLVVSRAICGAFNGSTDRFPEIFGRSELLKTYPYLLTFSVSSIFASVAWLVTYFHLKESISTRVPLWELIKGGFFRWSHSSGSPREANSGGVLPKPLPLHVLLTPKVSTVTASYATTGPFHMSFISILPVFYATPIELGGLSLDPPHIGSILAASGIAHGVFQLLFYARLYDLFGAGAIHITGVSSGIIIVILFPVINALARAHGMGVTVLIMCYPLFVRAAAPNRASLGATNGIAQMFVAGARIIAPASAASIFSYSMQEGHDAWLVYYFLMAIAFLAVGTSLLLPRDPSIWEDHQ
ncbi:MFS general substrate transporter [Suillus hirtellus]|nr:MFS general substrate transporter [Suillus hirtellus]